MYERILEVGLGMTGWVREGFPERVTLCWPECQEGARHTEVWTEDSR